MDSLRGSKDREGVLADRQTPVPMRKLGEQTLVCASQEMPPQLSESDGAELKGEAHPDVWAFYREKRAADLMSQLEKQE